MKCDRGANRLERRAGADLRDERRATEPVYQCSDLNAKRSVKKKKKTKKKTPQMSEILAPHGQMGAQALMKRLWTGCRQMIKYFRLIIVQPEPIVNLGEMRETTYFFS